MTTKNTLQFSFGELSVSVGKIEYSTSSAIIVGDHRYKLVRGWGLPPKRVLWIMLNPSTADQFRNDATINKTIMFSTGFGFNHETVCNLFTLRATDKKALLVHPEINGVLADGYLRELIAEADQVICAWGDGPKPKWKPHEKRVLAVCKMIRDAGKVPQCLGVTASGNPRHPLYLKKSTPLIEYVPEFGS
jgi:hypothetical protein